jgi:hypothetical protein
VHLNNTSTSAVLGWMLSCSHKYGFARECLLRNLVSFAAGGAPSVYERRVSLHCWWKFLQISSFVTVVIIDWSSQLTELSGEVSKCTIRNVFYKLYSLCWLQRKTKMNVGREFLFTEFEIKCYWACARRAVDSMKCYIGARRVPLLERPHESVPEC